MIVNKSKFSTISSLKRCMQVIILILWGIKNISLFLFTSDFIIFLPLNCLRSFKRVLLLPYVDDRSKNEVRSFNCSLVSTIVKYIFIKRKGEVHFRILLTGSKITEIELILNCSVHLRPHVLILCHRYSPSQSTGDVIYHWEQDFGGRLHIINIRLSQLKGCFFFIMGLWYLYPNPYISLNTCGSKFRK